MKKKYLISLTIIALAFLYGIFGLILVERPVSDVVKYRLIAGVVVICIDALLPLLFLSGETFDEKIPGIYLLGLSFVCYPVFSFLFIYLVSWKLALEIIVLVSWTIVIFLLVGTKALLSLHIRDVRENEKIIDRNLDVRELFDTAELTLKQRFSPAVIDKIVAQREDYRHIAPCNTSKAQNLDSLICAEINHLMVTSDENDAMKALNLIDDYIQARAKCFSK